ncbi:UDP-glucoronosyl and UDP-glucosyl transferase [Ceratobasidium sp. AG-Ba]|nr:UDP-glucoronosyl and UDP-glucosyl transferase [Ceratobasidium sp. AG-Ba]
MDKSSFHPRTNNNLVQTKLKHVVFVTGFGWTHIRPNLHFCIRLAAKFPTVYISIYTPGTFASQIDEYLATYPKLALERILIVASVVDNTVKGPLDLMYAVERNFGPWIADQITSPNLADKRHLVEPPSYIIEDHVNGGIAVANKKFHELPIVGWYAATAAGLLGHYGNTEHGKGWRYVRAVCAAVAKKDPRGERPLEEVFAEELIPNRLICPPGLPPHYEHEQMPQFQPDMLPATVHMHERYTTMLENVVGMIYSSVYEIEPIAAIASTKGFSKPLTSWFTGLSIDIPPLIPFDIDRATSDPVMSFMNRAYIDLGQHSVIYIAFGSYCFPARESIPHLKILIKEVLAQSFRLIFSAQDRNLKASGFDREYIAKLTATGQAIVPEWTNQLAVLEHPAIHYFVSHGGWNSVSEAIADQPNNTMQMSRQLDCGFELLQIRTGAARTVVYGSAGDISIIGSDEAVQEEVRNVLEMTKGPRGAQQRLSVKVLGKVVAESVEDEGSADVALRKLGAFLGL